VAGTLVVEPAAVAFWLGVKKKVQKTDAEGTTDREAIATRVSFCCFIVTDHSRKLLKVQFWHVVFQFSLWLRKTMPDDVTCEDCFFFPPWVLLFKVRT